MQQTEDGWHRLVPPPLRWIKSFDRFCAGFLVLSRATIFLLGWPLERTECIVIFAPVVLPRVDHFDIDPLGFGVHIALDLQAAFLPPPVAMAAFYLKRMGPAHATFDQIIRSMMPFVVVQILAMALLYLFSQLALWLPKAPYQ